MSGSRLRRYLGVGVALAGLATLLLVAPTGATTISHPNDVIAASGSDTTEAFMNQVMTGAKEYNVPTIFATKFHVPGDSHCSNPGPNGDPQSDAGVSWSSDPNAAASGGVGVADGTSVLIEPNGSGDGRQALIDSENHKLFNGKTTFGNGGAALQVTDNGCFDIARSSGDPRAIGSNESSNFEYYAFALDDVTVASPSRQAPASLSIDQIRNIFNCTWTDWSQVPGNPGRGQIQRFFPTASSGTGDTFIKKVLGGDSPFNHTSGSCPAVKTIEENRGDRFVSSTADPNSYSGFIDQAILPFSAGKWDYFANNYFNPTIDIRGGVRLLGQVPSGATIGTDPPVFPVLWNGTAGKFRIDQSDGQHVTEANPNIITPSDTGTVGNKHLSGVRYIYNVLDTQTGSYNVARQIAGFDPAANPSATTGGICAGTYGSTIIDQGFAQLPSQVDSGSATAVRCRKDPTPHPLTASITNSPAGPTVSRATNPTVVYTITFSSNLTGDLTAGQVQTTNTGSCVFAISTPHKVYTETCTPTADGLMTVSVPSGSVSATIGAFTVSNQTATNSALTSAP